MRTLEYLRTTYARDRTAARALHLTPVDAAVEHHVVRDGIVRDVAGIVDVGAILVARCTIAAEVAVGEVVVAYEHPQVREVVGRPVPPAIAVVVVIVVEVDGEGDSATARIELATHEAIVRRHRHPAGHAVIRTPHHPCRAPYVTGNPKPTVVGIVDPAAIVERDIAPRVVGDPGPAVIVGVGPVAGGIVGAEIRADVRHPHLAPTVAVDPIAIAREFALEHVETHVRLRLGRRGGKDDRWNGERAAHHGQRAHGAIEQLLLHGVHPRRGTQ